MFLLIWLCYFYPFFYQTPLSISLASVLYKKSILANNQGRKGKNHYPIP